MNKSWIPSSASSHACITFKTPTSVLLDCKGQFHSFGYAAEDKFGELAEDNQHQGWRLFRHFKMKLHSDKNVMLESTIDDLQGMPHCAIEIFSMALHFLHEHAVAAVKLQCPSILETDFQYVITVPAIWDVRAKCFMSEAAQMAGIDGKRLELAHEPEAAALWCCSNSTEGHPGDDLQTIGSKYMVVDLGGGTADISVHQVTPNRTIKVIHKASGGLWGGIYVDQQYLKYLNERYGNEAIEKVRENHIGDLFDLIRDFENKKRATAYKSETLFIFRIPCSLRKIKKRFSENTYIGSTLVQLLYGAKSNEPDIDNEKMRIKSAITETWFEKPVSCIIDHIKGLLKHENMKDIHRLLLVGGFGESQYVQDRFREELTEITLVVPREPGLAVLKGAVLFGHNPGLVVSRVMTYTYGIGGYGAFDETKHPIEKNVLLNGEWLVKNVFKIFVKANEEITVEHEVTHDCIPTAIRSGNPVYRTLSETPEYITDPGCELLGKLTLKNADNVPLKDQPLKVTFIFGNTELLVKVYNTVTCEVEMLSLDCLQ